MFGYEKYNLILCIIVFTVLTALFSVMITTIVKYTLRTVNAGLDDEKIEKEYLEEQKKKSNAFFVIINNAFPIIVCVILACALCFSLYSRFTQNAKLGPVPTIKVVETGSMETKHEDNIYLVENNLNNQIKTFDLIVLHQLPKEEDLKLYDIVVYEIKGYFILHRIVDIEEPNENHPNQRWFLLRGDANKYSDDFPVTYDQMRSIYRGESIPFVGTFVVFMQSPAGMLCFLLVLLAIITTPIVEKKLQKAIKIRLVFMGYLPNGARRAVKHCVTYKEGNKTLLKVTSQGKSVDVCLADNSVECTGVKYGQEAAHIKIYRNYSVKK